MNAVYLLLGVVSGGIIAWILNKLLANKVDNKGYRIGLKVAAYIVCIVLGITFAVTCSLRTVLNTFITNRIEFMERKLVEIFPTSNITEKSIDTNELSQIVDELKQTVNGIDTSGDSFLESLIYDAFLNKLNGYIRVAETGVNTIAAEGNETGAVTMKSVLYTVKDMSLETAAPYFIFGQAGILILLVVFIGIYAGFVLFLKKGGAVYNKSIVYGDDN